ncbi:MAG: DUF3606 domain-containing protein [Methylobacterium sp.]|uniref:DUF3606 domain-containing protein n=1 Tax=Methylobacterium sp. TaxID=409 RepID=UPI002585D51E|nr:DUF3606 domain-containing protein [Methylobacterium sp.]MBY0295388.1 DUF3606 domain-containing protein [Methylobacterium sp.]
MTSGTGASARRHVRHIDIYCPNDLAHWSQRLGISDAQLRQTVKLVGTRAATVAAHHGISL